MFRSIKNFFLDFAVPIGLSIVNPALGAAYSGIKTGIQTGSPLAGIGAAGLSLATSSAFKGLGPAVKGPTQMVTEASKEAGIQAASKASETALGSGIAKGFRSAIDPAFTGAARAATESLTPNVIERVGGSIFDTATQGTFAGGLPANTIAGKGVRMLPEFIQEASPLAVGAGSFALKEMATPPPPPAPIGNMQAPKRDFSKYAYKGPLQRGEYTYADPEDIAYGRTTNYGYLGAKEGGVIKAQGGGVMMQRGLLDPSIEATKGTFRAPESMGVIPGKLSQVAQTQPGMMPKPQQMQTMAQPIAPTVPLNMPMSQPQPPMNLPMQGLEQQAQQLINNLPKKDLNVNVSSQLQQAFGQLGLAQGGIIPESNIQMAQGGEVESNQELQENAFVIPADVVGHIGDGSSDAGAQRLQSYLGMNPQQYQAGGIMAGELQGPGGGMDDLIQTSIEGKRAAAVSPQEFVVPRDIVAELGQGSYDKGSNKLYALMKNVRKEKTGTSKQPAELQRGLGQLMRTAAA